MRLYAGNALADSLCMLYVHHLLMYVSQDDFMLQQDCASTAQSHQLLSADSACIAHGLYMTQKHLFWSLRCIVNYMCRLSLVTMQSQSWRTSRCGEPATTPALHTWTAKMLLGWLWLLSGALPIACHRLLHLVHDAMFGCNQAEEVLAMPMLAVFFILHRILFSINHQS